MKNLSFIILTIALMAIVSCGKKTDSGRLNNGQISASSSDSAEVRTLFESTVEPWNAGNLDPAAAVLADNVVQMPPDTVIRGKEALVTVWRRYLADNVVTWKPRVLQVGTNGDMAFLTVESTESAAPRSGGTTRKIDALMLEVYRRDASGTWKNVLESWYYKPLEVPSRVKGGVPVTAVEEQVKAAWDAYVAVSGPAQIEKAIAMLHEDVVHIPPNGNVSVGKEVLADKWRKMMKDVPDYLWEPELLDVVVAGDLGFVRYTGSEKTKIEGKLTTTYVSGWEIFRKDGDNGWKIIHESWFVAK